MTVQIGRAELLHAYEAVSTALGKQPLESLHDAAMRVFRQNCAPQVTLDVARVVLEMGGKPSDQQWRLMAAAAKMVRASLSSAN